MHKDAQNRVLWCIISSHTVAAGSINKISNQYCQNAHPHQPQGPGSVSFRNFEEFFFSHYHQFSNSKSLFWFSYFFAVESGASRDRCFPGRLFTPDIMNHHPALGSA